MSIRMFRRFAAPLWFILLFSPIALLSSEAVAGCCQCGYCWLMYSASPPPCYCGYYGCPNCSTDEYNLLRFDGVSGHASSDISLLPETPRSAMTELYVPQGIVDLLSGSRCFRQKVALSLLGVRKGLQFIPARFDEKSLVSIVRNKVVED